MDFSFNKDQELIRKSAKAFFSKECPPDKARELKHDSLGHDPFFWKKMIDLGYLGLLYPEAYGGTEGDFVDAMIIMEEMGRNLVSSPYFTTTILCGLPILKYGTETQKKEILPMISDNGQIWTLAFHEKAVNFDPSDILLSATKIKDQYILNGIKLFVPYANCAEKMIVCCRTNENKHPSYGLTLFMVDKNTSGISMEEIPTTAKDKKFQVTFTDVSVPESHILGEREKGWEIIEFLLQNASVLKCAEISGSAQQAFDITVKYTRERTQFGKSIGTFQAVQHRLVDLLTDVDALKNLVYEASWRISEGMPDKQLNAIAKVKANTVHQKICYTGITTHGAIGFTEEMDIGLYHLRSKAFEYDMGSTDFHMEKIAAELEKKVPVFTQLHG